MVAEVPTVSAQPDAPTAKSAPARPAVVAPKPAPARPAVVVPKWINPLLDEALAQHFPQSPIPHPSIRCLRVLYIFAGERRRSDIQECFSTLCSGLGVDLKMLELDTCRDPAQDVLLESVQKTLIARIESHEFDVVVVTPPCSSWSRALFNRKPGPRPVRDRRHPWGYPWLQKRDFARCNNGNIFVRFSLHACQSAFNVGCKFLLEHPEDLGKTRDGFTPASIFNLNEMRDLISSTSASTSAF